MTILGAYLLQAEAAEWLFLSFDVPLLYARVGAASGS